MQHISYVRNLHLGKRSVGHTFKPLISQQVGQHIFKLVSYQEGGK